MGELLLVDKLENPEGIVADLRDHGAISLPLLKEEARLRLIEEANSCFFRVVDREAGGVIQEAEACQVFSNGSLCIALKNELQDLLYRSLTEYNPYPFRTTLNFDTLYLLRYKAGSIGITPHFDSPEYVNLMAGFILRGSGRFYICDDLGKTNSRELNTTPGNIILMVAPGFIPNSSRQYHYLDRVTKDRDSLWIRQYKWGGAYPRLTA